MSALTLTAVSKRTSPEVREGPISDIGKKTGNCGGLSALAVYRARKPIVRAKLGKTISALWTVRILVASKIASIEKNRALLTRLHIFCGSACHRVVQNAVIWPALSWLLLRDGD